MAPPKIVTLGCRLNAFESEVMRERALAAGLADTVIVNTCAVTAEAERQARQTIRKLRREHPKARLVVTGCAAQLGAQKFAAMPEVDSVVGNIDKLEAANLNVAAGAERIRVTDIMAIRETAGHLIDTPLISDFGERTRAFAQIQQGCDHRCTFCVIPFARGPVQLFPVLMPKKFQPCGASFHPVSSPACARIDSALIPVCAAILSA